MHDTTGGESTFSRRMFLERGMTLASMAATAPLFLDRSARAMMRPDGALLTSRPGVPEDRVLVVVQLGGGNDGLNTVVPYGAADYYRLRPTLAIREPARGTAEAPAALELDPGAGMGLHPALVGIKALFDEGKATIVQGVGYPNPNRSHFTSMDIWHTGRDDAKGDGWIGRYFDACCSGAPVPEGAIAIGRTAPLALHGRTQTPVAFESEEMFRWAGGSLHEALAPPYDDITRAGALDGVEGDSQAAFLMRTGLEARVSSDRIRRAVARAPLVPYPGGPLAMQLRVIGSMIRDGMGTRVYYASLGGFDTHAAQRGRHAQLLRQLGDALRTFQADLAAQGNAGRVLTMVFSEFGRRVAQNGSGGTDHGTAAPMYLIGDMVRPGLLGTHPRLSDLDQGDLRHTVDFRCVYASILEDWMGADAEKVLGKKYRKAAVVA